MPQVPKPTFQHPERANLNQINTTNNSNAIATITYLIELDAFSKNNANIRTRLADAVRSHFTIAHRLSDLSDDEIAAIERQISDTDAKLVENEQMNLELSQYLAESFDDPTAPLINLTKANLDAQADVIRKQKQILHSLDIRQVNTQSIHRDGDHADTKQLNGNEARLAKDLVDPIHMAIYAQIALLIIMRNKLVVRIGLGIASHQVRLGVSAETTEALLNATRLLQQAANNQLQHGQQLIHEFRHHIENSQPGVISNRLAEFITSTMELQDLMVAGQQELLRHIARLYAA